MEDFSTDDMLKALKLSNVGVWKYVISTKEVKWNQQMFFMFEKDVDTPVYYEDIISKIHSEDRENIDNKFTNATENDKHIDLRFRVLWKDNSLHFYQSYGEKYINNRGMECILGTMTDITSYYLQKEKEKEKMVLKHQTDYNTRHNTEMHIIMRTVAHEIRNPLQGILGSATIIDDMLEKVSSEEPDIVSGLNIMKGCMDDLMECIYHQLNTLNDLIDYNLQQRGAIVGESVHESVDLEEIFSSILKMFNPNAKNKNNILSSYIDKDLCEIISDPKRIKRIIINLVSNALKFTKDGTVHVSATKDIKTNKCIITVTDTGIGISDKNKKHIFTKIGESTTTAADITSGSGLGLSICKKLVSSINGNIYCKNNLPKGTKMSFEFELIHNIDDMIDYERISRNNSELMLNSFDVIQNRCAASIDIVTENTILNKKNMKDKIVLLADDSIINQKVVARMLKDNVKEIVIVSNGIEILEQFHNKKFDIIILDVHMPIMSGIEAATIIRNTDFFTPILFLTGEAMTSELSHFKKSVVLLKPCAKADLLRTCTAMLLL